MDNNILNYKMLNEDKNIIEQYKNLSNILYEKCKNILLNNINNLKILSNELLEKEVLNEKEIYSILKD